MGGGRSKMGEFSMDSVPSLVDKVYFVTGSNTGLGLETCKELARKGATVVMSYRNPTKSKKAVDDVKAIAKENGGKVEEIVLDLADMESIKKCAQEFQGTGLPLHGLINNAGVMMCPYSKTKDGLEMQFGTNHIGHFLLTTLLFPVLKRTADDGETVRIVNLTSSYHSKGPREGILFDNLLWEDPNGPKYNPGLAYGHSKFANVVFTQELANRLGPDSSIIANCVHPGFVDTELVRHVEKKYGSLIIRFFKWYNGALTVQRGALTQLYVAASPEIESKNLRGQYFAPIAKHTDLSPECPEITQEMRDKLWSVSEEITGIPFQI